MPFGTEMLKGLGVHFRIFAPGVDQMRLQLDNTPGPLIMNSPKGGWRRSFIRNAAVGTRYSFILPDGTQVPDPALEISTRKRRGSERSDRSKAMLLG
jgi:1,4-alpha-glucan branching enzyme